MSEYSKKYKVFATIVIFAIVSSLIILSNLVLDLKSKYLVVLHLFLLALFINILFFFKWRSSKISVRNKKALEESENKYKELVESLIEGIGIVDKKENFTFANKAGNEIFGCKNGELVGKNLKEFTTEDSFNSALKKTENKKLGNTDIYELEIVGLDKIKRTILVKTSPVLGENGEYEGAFGFFADITEQKKYEEKRERIVKELETKLSNGKHIANGFLPICASCHNIRDKENIWHPVADYLSKHTNIKFSHSVCPDCKDEIYGSEDKVSIQRREYSILD